MLLFVLSWVLHLFENDKLLIIQKNVIKNTVSLVLQ